MKINISKWIKTKFGLWVGSLVVSSVVFIFFSLAIFSQLNNLILDIFNPSLVPNNQIVVIGIGDRSLQELGAWPWSRDKFANLFQKIDQNAKPKAIGVDIFFGENRDGDDDLIRTLNQIQYPVVLASKLEKDKIIQPIFLDQTPKTSSGYVDVLPDSDGKIRRHRYAVNNDDRQIEKAGDCVDSFALKILQQATQDINYLCQNWFGTKNFNYPVTPFERIEFVDLIRDVELQKKLDKKIALVGITTNDIKNGVADIFTGIDGQKTNGIEINGAFVNSALSNRFQTFLSPIQAYLIILVISAGLVFVFNKFKASLANFATLILFIIVFQVIGIFVYDFGISLNFVQSTAVFGSNLIYFTSYQYLTADSQKKFIEQAFSRYLSPNLLKDLLENPEKLNLQGQKKEMTMLFCDLIGFTSLSEKLESTELVAVLNKYLEAMTQIILKRGGTVDKYIGDGIMAFWNAPLADPKHQSQALLTAVEMGQKMGEIRKMKGCQSLNIGIGINTGNVVVGNIGSKVRFDYTVIGDNVNIAARLEALTRRYGVEVIASEATLSNQDLANIGLIKIQIDKTVVKGKKQPINIFNIVDDNSQNQKLKNCFEEGFNFYLQGNLKMADQYWQRIDYYPPVETLKNRFEDIKKLLDTPQGWDGVWVWQEK